MSDTIETTTNDTTNGSSGEEFNWEGEAVEAEKSADGRVSRSRIDLPRYKRALAGIGMGKQRVWRVPTGEIIAPIVKLDEDGNPVINPNTKRKVLENPGRAGHGDKEIEDEKGLRAAATALGYSVLVEPRHIVEGPYAGMTALRIVPSEKRELKPENEYARQIGAAAGSLWADYLNARDWSTDEELSEEDRTGAKESMEGLLKAAVDGYKVRAIWQQARKDGNYTIKVLPDDENGRAKFDVEITGPGYVGTWDGKTLDKETRRPNIVVKSKAAPVKQAPTKQAAPAAN